MSLISEISHPPPGRGGRSLVDSYTLPRAAAIVDENRMRVSEQNSLAAFGRRRGFRPVKIISGGIEPPQCLIEMSESGQMQ